MTQNKKFLTAMLWGAILILLTTVQCGQHEKMVGKYQSVDGRLKDQMPITLELQPNGKGLWSVEGDNASFRWNLSQDKIQLHTQTGGVIEGAIHEDTIQITLPGMNAILFRLER